MRELLELVTVEKVTTDRERSFIRLYIESERLIQKRNIYILEASIKKQLFSGYQTEVKIQEKFRLSAQYDPEKLMDAYRGQHSSGAENLQSDRVQCISEGGLGVFRGRSADAHGGQ